MPSFLGNCVAGRANLPSPARLATDANLVTGIGVSGSIGPQGRPYTPPLVQTVAGGHHGRIGCAGLTWSSQGHVVMLVLHTEGGLRSFEQWFAGMPSCRVSPD